MTCGEGERETGAPGSGVGGVHVAKLDASATTDGDTLTNEDVDLSRVILCLKEAINTRTGEGKEEQDDAP
jgi:hypothetical protein